MKLSRTQLYSTTTQERETSAVAGPFSNRNWFIWGYSERLRAVTGIILQVGHTLPFSWHQVAKLKKHTPDWSVDMYSKPTAIGGLVFQSNWEPTDCNTTKIQWCSCCCCCCCCCWWWWWWWWWWWQCNHHQTCMLRKTTMGHFLRHLRRTHWHEESYVHSRISYPSHVHLQQFPLSYIYIYNWIYAATTTTTTPNSPPHLI